MANEKEIKRTLPPLAELGNSPDGHRKAEREDLNKRIAELQQDREIAELKSHIKKLQFEYEHPIATKFASNFKASARGIGSTIKEKMDAQQAKSKSRPAGRKSRRKDSEDSFKFNMGA